MHEARALIEDEGLDAVSFRRLAQRLGVTAPALYAYVSDKDDLLRSITSSEFVAIMGSYRRDEDEDPVEAVRRFCHQYIDYAVTHPALYKTMFLFPPWGDTELASTGLPEALSQFAVPYQAVVDAVDRRLFRDESPLLAALTLWTAMHGLAEVLLLGIPGDDRRDRFVDLVIATAIDGLRAPPV